MKCPILSELPLPSTEKMDWPWTEETSPLDERMPDGSQWPKISVVTPSYNQGQFLEETIRSVLLQGYPNLEYIIIDGGSTDESVEIIQKYEKYLSYWISEKDRGQSHAINKGFAKSTGDILCWLNSDDLFKPNALKCVVQTLKNTSRPAWMIGASEIIDQKSSLLRTRTVHEITNETLLIWYENWFPQQSTFWTRSMWEKVHPINEHLHYVMDLALWCSMFKLQKPFIHANTLSCYRYHQDSKCISDPRPMDAEMNTVISEFIKYIATPHRKDLSKKVIIHAYRYCRNRYYGKAQDLLANAIQLYPALLLNRSICDVLMLTMRSSIEPFFRKVKRY